ncbi:MAG TPA: glycoside hydrolase family 20 zincin-like fold domain-containing protein [Candidatus Acidoferrales bacterium]|nr:glycoside hydrolase family 20 zincin-like fold domain-containing protein [Candidatus Acidoferrales bacterium]
MFASLLALVALHVLPQPDSVIVGSCSIAPPHVAPASIDPGALDEWRERWDALGIARVTTGADSPLRVVHDASLGAQAYRLSVSAAGITIASADADGTFYAVMTLAQMPAREHGRWVLPCATIADRPALRWRILSDDVSRGPLPTMAFFEERIRTIAFFKMNGYSPYMEQVFASPTDPLPAWPDGITPAQLHALDLYAKRYHVALIPEQQTFAHMHGTLRLERYASAADFPHGFLLDPGNTLAAAYLTRIIGQELAAVPRPPFFHIGSDETATLGEGTNAAYVKANGGRGAVYAKHVAEMTSLIAPSGARVMIWDDGIEADPSIMKHIPRDTVIVNWHYGAEKTFEPYIKTIAGGGFAQMVAPGANNWSRIFPDVPAALANEKLFVDQGKAARVLGLFETVWNDDGETLFNSTWYPVLFAASDAWGRSGDFSRDFSSAFFGVDGGSYANACEKLGELEAMLPAPSDRLFWADPFAADAAAVMAQVDLRALRLQAEGVASSLLAMQPPPMHAGAARALLLAAQRYDALGRRYQIAREVRDYYADASTNANRDDALRDLFWCRYWFWEQRDTDERLASLYARAWRSENREDHLASNLERYHLDAQLAIQRADAIDRVIYDDFVRYKPLPPLDGVLGIAP